MQHPPYFIALRKFDPQSSLLSVVRESDLEAAWTLSVRFSQLETPHLHYMAIWHLSYWLDLTATFLDVAIEKQCHGNILKTALSIVEKQSESNFQDAFTQWNLMTEGENTLQLVLFGNLSGNWFLDYIKD